MGVTVCEKDLRQSESSGSFTMCCGDADANGQRRIHVSQKQTEAGDAALQEAPLPIHVFSHHFHSVTALASHFSCIYLLCIHAQNSRCLPCSGAPFKVVGVDCA